MTFWTDSENYLGERLKGFGFARIYLCTLGFFIFFLRCFLGIFCPFEFLCTYKLIKAATINILNMGTRLFMQLCILVLPPGAVIPLHNHPGMTVLSKLLVGSMHIKAYDWVDPVRVVDSKAPSTKCKWMHLYTYPFYLCCFCLKNNQKAHDICFSNVSLNAIWTFTYLTEVRLARLVVDSVFAAPCKSSILFPTTGGNIHTFVASTPCVVLDVLGPPYLNEDGRDCTYYKEHPYCHVQSKHFLIAYLMISDFQAQNLMMIINYYLVVLSDLPHQHFNYFELSLMDIRTQCWSDITICANPCSLYSMTLLVYTFLLVVIFCEFVKYNLPPYNFNFQCFIQLRSHGTAGTQLSSWVSQRNY